MKRIQDKVKIVFRLSNTDSLGRHSGLDPESRNLSGFPLSRE
jgi:hypothetical protein